LLVVRMKLQVWRDFWRQNRKLKSEMTVEISAERKIWFSYSFFYCDTLIIIK
jgi:hypothetical protein